MLSISRSDNRALWEHAVTVPLPRLELFMAKVRERKAAAMKAMHFVPGQML